MPEELKRLIEEQGRAWEELKRLHTESDAQLRKVGTELPETKAAMGRINDRMDAIETALQRPMQIVVKDKDQKAPTSAEMRAFEKFLRHGQVKAFEVMNEEERAAFTAIRKKSLSEGDDAKGGTFVPEDFRLEVIRKIPNYSRVGALATRQVTSRDVLRYPKLKYTADDIKTSNVTVTWEDETDPVTETDFTLGSTAVPVKKARALMKISNDLLEDDAIDIVALATDLLAESFGVEDDRVFTVGANPRQPEGFMTNDELEVINSTNAGNFTYDGLVDLVYGLPEQYSENALFMCRRRSVANLRKIKDTTNQPIWQPGMQAGQPATLLGYPLKTNEHMPAIAANAVAAIFADFRRLYLVAEKIGMTVRRLDERYAETDETGFIARRRVGGKVQAPWAGKKHRIAV
jgi:HK97 family phage major capsid protein